MELKNETNTNIEDNGQSYQDLYPFQQPPKSTSKPLVAGILLIIAGIISILYWVMIIVSADFFISMMDISQLQQMDPSITAESIKNTLVLCGTVLVVISVFPILGGILSLKKKSWGLVVAFSIFGLFTLGMMFISTILSFVAMILLIMSRKEFQ